MSNMVGTIHPEAWERPILFYSIVICVDSVIQYYSLLVLLNCPLNTTAPDLILKYLSEPIDVVYNDL